MSRQEFLHIPALQIAPAGVSKRPDKGSFCTEHMPVYCALSGLLNISLTTHFIGQAGSWAPTGKAHHSIRNQNPTVSTRAGRPYPWQISLHVVENGGYVVMGAGSGSLKTSISRTEPTHLNHGVCKHQTIQVNQTNNLQGIEALAESVQPCGLCKNHLIERLMKP